MTCSPRLRVPFCAFLLLASVAWAQTGHPRPAVKSAGKPQPRQEEPTGPVVVIDTTQGRLTCRLYDRQAPRMSANFLGLATGTKDWRDGATGQTVHGKPFYDGNSIYGVSDGFGAGDRLGGDRGVAGDPFPEEKSGLSFDVPGRLAMSVRTTPNGRMTSSSVFYVTTAADAEFVRRGAEVFGQCDPASVRVAQQISSSLLETDNHPAVMTGINHIAVWEQGKPAPPVAENIGTDQLTPQLGPAPKSLIPSPEPTGPTAKIETNLGTLSCRLFTETPIATQNFIGLATGSKDWKHPATHATMHGKPFYNGLTFSRIIPDFMIQNADVPGGNGGGDIGFTFGVEQVPGLLFDRPGRLAYANAGPDTNASEFFITEVPNSRLDGNFTIFGQCDPESVKLAAAIARVPRDEHNKPLRPVIIKTVAIER